MQSEEANKMVFIEVGEVIFKVFFYMSKRQMWHPVCLCVRGRLRMSTFLINHNKGKQTISSRINQSCSAEHRIHLCQQVTEQ